MLPRNRLPGVNAIGTLGLRAALGTSFSLTDRPVTPEISGWREKTALTFESTSSEYQQSSSGKATMQFCWASCGSISAKAAARAALRPLESPRSDRTTRMDKRSDQAETIG